MSLTKELVEALKELERSCTRGMECGDWGFFTVDQWPELAKARALILRAEATPEPVAGRVSRNRAKSLVFGWRDSLSERTRWAGLSDKDWSTMIDAVHSYAQELGAIATEALRTAPVSPTAQGYSREQMREIALKATGVTSFRFPVWFDRELATLTHEGEKHE